MILGSSKSMITANVDIVVLSVVREKLIKQVAGEAGAPPERCANTNAADSCRDLFNSDRGASYGHLTESSCWETFFAP